MSSVAFVCLVLLSISVSHDTLIALARQAYATPEYSHLFSIIPLSAVLIWIEHKTIFAKERLCLTTAMVAMGTWVALAAVLAAVASHLSPGVQLAASAFALVTFWIAAFCASFGTAATRRALFPLSFLLLLVPIPQGVMDVFVTYLQRASANTVEWLFRATGIPFLRHGERFALATVEIEVAKECSGIRSTIALFITCLLSSHLLLQSKLNRVVLLAVTLPVAVAKNALRIFTLSVLTVYVDPAFVSGTLHRRGGFVFFGLAVLTLFALLRILVRLENRSRTPNTASPKARQAAEGTVIEDRESTTA